MIKGLLNNHTALSRARLMKGFSGSVIESDLEKAITVEQFNDKYEAGFNVFNREGIERFKEDALKKGATVEEIADSLAVLTKLYIQKGEDVIEIFVSPIVNEEEN